MLRCRDKKILYSIWFFTFISFFVFYVEGHYITEDKSGKYMNRAIFASGQSGIASCF